MENKLGLSVLVLFILLDVVLCYHAYNAEGDAIDLMYYWGLFIAAICLNGLYIMGLFITLKKEIK